MNPFWYACINGPASTKGESTDHAVIADQEGMKVIEIFTHGVLLKANNSFKNKIWVLAQRLAQDNLNLSEKVGFTMQIKNIAAE